MGEKRVRSHLVVSLHFSRSKKEETVAMLRMVPQAEPVSSMFTRHTRQTQQNSRTTLDLSDNGLSHTHGGIYLILSVTTAHRMLKLGSMQEHDRSYRT